MIEDPPNWDRPTRIDYPWTVVCTECSSCGASVANWERHEKWHFDRAATATARNAAAIVASVPAAQQTADMKREIDWAMRYAKTLS